MTFWRRISSKFFFHEGVEGLGRVLTVRALAGHADADAGGDVADAAGPHEAVEGGIDAHLF